MNRLLIFLRILLPVSIIAALAVPFIWALGRDPSVLPSALIDQPVPQFSLPPVDGVDRPGLSGDDLKGQVALVNFFASWCVPCLAEHPLITRLAEDGVPVFGINYKNEPAEAKAWLEKYGNPYSRIGADHEGRVGIDFGVTGMPESYIVDHTGIIRYKQVGVITPATLDKTILPLIARLRRDAGGP